MSMPTTSDHSRYQAILNDNLTYIEQQCRKIIHRKIKMNPLNPDQLEIEIENTALELINTVMDKLQANGFKILRQFNGKSKITTYMTTVISRTFVDQLRSKIGRNRDRERAEKLGPLGKQIYQLRHVEKLEREQVIRRIQEDIDQTAKAAEIDSMIDRIDAALKTKNLSTAVTTGSPIKAGMKLPDDKIVVPDPGKGPEETLLLSEKKVKHRQAISHLLDQLSTEERFVLKNRFYQDDLPLKLRIEAISRALNMEKRNVYKKIDRLLKKCKKMLMEQGLDINELIK